MPLTARESHIAAQRRRPLAYWAVGAVVIASLGLCAIDQRLGFVALMITALAGGLIRSWGTDTPDRSSPPARRPAR